MNDRFVAILSAGIAGTLLALAGTYKEYRPSVDLILIILSAVSSFLAIYEFFRKK